MALISEGLINTFSPMVFSIADGESNTRKELERIARDKEEVTFIEGTQNFMEFVSSVKSDGLSYAIYEKPFSEVAGGFFKELAHDTGNFILSNSDLFFLLPAIVFMFGTFMVGKNRFTKWILPLWFAYAISRMFYMMIN